MQPDTAALAPGATHASSASTPSPYDQQTLLPADMCVDALVAAEGNSNLAAERLHITPQVLVASIAQDPSAQASLNSQLRTLTTLMTFDTMRLAQAVVGEMMSNMEPGEFAKFFTDLTRQVTALTDSHETTQNINVSEVALKMLPPHVRAAVLAFAQPFGPPTGPPPGGPHSPNGPAPQDPFTPKLTRSPLDDFEAGEAA